MFVSGASKKGSGKSTPPGHRAQPVSPTGRFALGRGTSDWAKFRLARPPHQRGLVLCPAMRSAPRHLARNPGPPSPTMTLTPEQTQTVSTWVAAGDNLSVIQRKLSEHFQLSLTYMDVRFLVDDLGLELKNATPKAETDLSKAPAPRPAAATPAPEKKGFIDKLKETVGLGEPAADPGDEDELPPEAFPEDAPAGAAPGGLSIEVDRLTRPGTVVSGTVTFSDGVSGKWALDQYGRLMLDTGQPGYQPSPADVQTFQRELSAQLQRSGY